LSGSVPERELHVNIIDEDIWRQVELVVAKTAGMKCAHTVYIVLCDILVGAPEQIGDRLTKYSRLAMYRMLLLAPCSFFIVAQSRRHSNMTHTILLERTCRSNAPSASAPEARDKVRTKTHPLVNTLSKLVFPEAPSPL
jgi:hypothetical protein